MGLSKLISERFDGWLNLLTGVGRQGFDKRQNTVYEPGKELSEDDLINIYRFDGMGTKIVDVFTEDITRKWFKVKGDTDGNIQKELRKIEGRESITEAIRWALLFGGSVGVMGVDDGGLYEDPVDENNIKKITHIHVFDRFRAIWTTADLYNDPSHPLFGTPEFYSIFPINPAGSIGGLMYSKNTNGITTTDTPVTTALHSGTSSPTIGMFRVHETRLLRFDGKQIPIKAHIRNRYWNDSVLLPCFERIRALGESYASVESLMSEFIVGTLTISNLQQLLATGKEDLVMKRLNLMDMSKRMMGTTLLDKEEVFERVSSNVAGMDAMIDKLIEGVSIVSGIPVTRLAGRSPAGMNATGESDENIYYDKVAGMQWSVTGKPLNRLCKYLMLSKESSFGGRELKDWELEFVPLQSMSELETATMRKTIADTDAVYIQNQVVTPGEIAESRFGGDNYSIDTHLSATRDSEGNLPEPEPLEVNGENENS